MKGKRKETNPVYVTDTPIGANYHCHYYAKPQATGDPSVLAFFKPFSPSSAAFLLAAPF